MRRRTRMWRSPFNLWLTGPVSRNGIQQQLGFSTSTNSSMRAENDAAWHAAAILCRPDPARYEVLIGSPLDPSRERYDVVCPCVCDVLCRTITFRRPAMNSCSMIPCPESNQGMRPDYCDEAATFLTHVPSSNPIGAAFVSLIVSSIAKGNAHRTGTSFRS